MFRTMIITLRFCLLAAGKRKNYVWSKNLTMLDSRSCYFGNNEADTTKKKRLLQWRQFMAVPLLLGFSRNQNF